VVGLSECHDLFDSPVNIIGTDLVSSFRSVFGCLFSPLDCLWFCGKGDLFVKRGNLPPSSTQCCPQSLVSCTCTSSFLFSQIGMEFVCPFLVSLVSWLSHHFPDSGEGVSSRWWQVLGFQDISSPCGGGVGEVVHSVV